MHSEHKLVTQILIISHILTAESRGADCLRFESECTTLFESPELLPESMNIWQVCVIFFETWSQSASAQEDRVVVTPKNVCQDKWRSFKLFRHFRVRIHISWALFVVWSITDIHNILNSGSIPIFWWLPLILHIDDPPVFRSYFWN
jgi:hypothetical protein